MVAQAVAKTTMTLFFAKKRWPSNFDPLFVFNPPFQHCEITQRWILHTSSGLPWWHKPWLWQQWRHILSKNHGETFLTSYPRSVTVLTQSRGAPSKFQQTQWVVMVAQAVAMATMTSNFDQKPWQSNFYPLFPIVLRFQHCHMTQQQFFHKPNGL